jgi:acyl-CoA thioester hydrolase
MGNDAQTLDDRLTHIKLTSRTMTRPLETFRGTVYPWHLDHMGHMNVQHYTARFDEATWHFFASIGITAAYLKSAGRGMAAVEQKTLYKRELVAGDLIYVHSELLELTAKSVRFRHHMFNAASDVEAASTELVAVHIDTALRKAAPFPASIFPAAAKAAP